MTAIPVPGVSVRHPARTGTHSPGEAENDAQRQDSVNPPLTHRGAKRPKREKDNLEYLDFMRRAIRGAKRRVIAEDPSTLADMVKLRDELDEAIAIAARSLHDQGWSWGEIGYELGITRQAAFQRWAKDEADG